MTKYVFFTVLFAAWSVSSVAIPSGLTSLITPAPNCSLKNFLDTFDERVALSVSASTVTAVGIEGALNYVTFALSSNTTSVLIQSPSKLNFVGAGLLGQVTSGQQPQLLPANSTVQYFNFESLAFACVTNANPAPASCTIHVIGTKGAATGGSQVTKDLVFNPGPVVTGGVVKQFGASTFPQPDWVGLVALTLSIVSAATSSATSLLVDNVGYHACINK